VAERGSAEWWVNLSSSFEPMPSEQEGRWARVEERLALAGWDADVIAAFVHEFVNQALHVDPEEEIPMTEPYSWFGFGIEMGIRAERARQLEEQIG
jgi:hypothetical protein